MRNIALIFIFFTSIFYGYSQNDDYMLWTKIGVKGKLSKKFSYTGTINTRFGGEGVETFFPQVGVEYKLMKWLKPSLEYRFIIDKNKYGNYKVSNRLNFNVELTQEVNRFNFGFRVRYQYAFNSISQQEYNPDFDQAFRFKPSIEYNIKGSKFTPIVSSEFFYDPQYGPFGRQFTKVRFAIGSKVNLKGPHSVGFKYQFDKKFNYKDGFRHVLALSYAYKIK